MEVVTTNVKLYSNSPLFTGLVRFLLGGFSSPGHGTSRCSSFGGGPRPGPGVVLCRASPRCGVDGPITSGH